MKKDKLITVLIPCYNEEKGVVKVIKGIPKQKLKNLGYNVEILVVDNNSKDNTTRVAKAAGARVVFEGKQGKGNAIRTGFKEISKDTDFVVMLDGDGTYHSEEIPRMIEPLESGFSDVVIGSRLEGKMISHSMSFSHRIANWYFTFMVRYFYGANVTDTCTGYFAWKKEVTDTLAKKTDSKGFAIESEMITKMAKMKYQICSVPITYSPRSGESKLSPIIDGLRITNMLIKNIFWKPR